MCVCIDGSPDCLWRSAHQHTVCCCAAPERDVAARQTKNLNYNGRLSHNHRAELQTFGRAPLSSSSSCRLPHAMHIHSLYATLLPSYTHIATAHNTGYIAFSFRLPIDRQKRTTALRLHSHYTAHIRKHNPVDLGAPLECVCV